MSSPLMMSEKTFDGFPINNIERFPHAVDPFASPAPSIAASGFHSRPVSQAPSQAGSLFPRKNRRVFKSTRVDPDELKQREPWYKTPVGRSTLRRTRWTCVGVSMLGVAASAALLVMTWLHIPKEKYCLVLEENFDGDSLNTDIWHHEVELGGFGNGEFEMTTTDNANSFVENGKLYIVPTLSNDTYGNDAILNGYTLNFTADGTCTSDKVSNCVITSNSTYGNISTLPPIRSARLTTKLSHSITYGRVEVVAKMPTGDWIWPAIWMLPTDNVYGEWPASGEIDIIETSGNMPTSMTEQAVNVVKTAIHWGLDYTTDMYRKTRGTYTMKQKYTNERFVTYGMDWSSKGIDLWTSLRSRVSLSVKFDKPFWNRGGFSGMTVNGSSAVNPWASSPNKAAPFDQDFYLILSVAVGGTNGFLTDLSNQVYAINSPTASRDFWNARSRWLPSWPSDPKERGMAVESVKIWRLAEKGETCAA
ncbi:hypothetical protein JCM8547_004748 [Rhodosporidiobolus lusitaniae]